MYYETTKVTVLRIIVCIVYVCVIVWLGLCCEGPHLSFVFNIFSGSRCVCHFRCIFILVVFFCYSVCAYIVASRKAERSKGDMKANFAIFGRLLGITSSFERAHYFGNVDHEVGIAKDLFDGAEA